MIDYDKSMYPEEEFGEAATLRDQFAMAALPTLLAEFLVCDSVAEIAARSYEFADAMMEARKTND